MWLPAQPSARIQRVVADARSFKKSCPIYAVASPLDFLSNPKSPNSPARKFPAWLLPAGILVGFGVVFGGLYQDRLLPAPAVHTEPVLATGDAAAVVRESPSSPSSGTPLFQATGWLEPAPFPIKASALVDGVVASVHVLEGDDVDEGQLLVTLVDDDARLALAVAEGQHRMLGSGRLAHLAAIEALTPKLAVARAEAMAAKTTKADAEDQLTRFDRLSKASVVSHSDFTTTRLRVEKESSLYLAALAREAEIEAEVRRMELETQTKTHEIEIAAVAVEQAQLALARTRISSPIAARVLRLATAPGDKKVLGMDDPHSAIVAILYDPKNLQVRVDVPLTDAAALQIGQRARIHTSMLNDKVFDGEVTGLAGAADIQRNTLQARVRLVDPVDQLRPEMLCRVEFLSPASGSDTDSPPGQAIALWVPESAIGGGAVWVCDPDTNRLSRRTIEVTDERRGEHIRVVAGLKAGEQVVLTNGDWREGQRVTRNRTAP